MREIKFRAWDKEYKKMRYLLRLLGHDEDGTYVNSFWNEDYGKLWTAGEDQFSELMQYIGLEDKNRKEIYENDIIKRNNGNKYIVEWNKEHSKFELFRIKDRYPVDFMELSAWKEQVEIIGNIYENPELLANIK